MCSAPKNAVELPTAEQKDGKMVPGSGAGAFAQREAPFQHRAHSVLLRNPADVPLLLPAALLELRQDPGAALQLILYTSQGSPSHHIL